MKEVLFSQTVTVAPRSAASIAVRRPHGPPPTITTWRIERSNVVLQKCKVLWTCVVIFSVCGWYGMLLTCWFGQMYWLPKQSLLIFLSRTWNRLTPHIERTLPWKNYVIRSNKYLHCMHYPDVDVTYTKGMALYYEQLHKSLPKLLSHRYEMKPI